MRQPSKIRPVRLPVDMDNALSTLITNQGRTRSQLIRGALLMAWADHFQHSLKYDRYVELVKSVLHNEKEDEDEAGD